MIAAQEAGACSQRTCRAMAAELFALHGIGPLEDLQGYFQPFKGPTPPRTICISTAAAYATSSTTRLPEELKQKQLQRLPSSDVMSWQ